jgi:predicted nucleotidyltransferase
MSVSDLDRGAIVRSLRAAGARFAFLHGSQVAGTAREDSDIDVAADFGGADPAPWDVDVPPRVDLVVLDRAPLELAGRVALHGELLFDDDPPARVEWQARTRLMYLDEEARQLALDRVFFEEHGRGR